MKRKVPHDFNDDLVVCVRHRAGWCATRRSHTRYADSVPTLCGHTVTLPWGFEWRRPDCGDCLSILGDAQAPKESEP